MDAFLPDSVKAILLGLLAIAFALSRSRARVETSRSCRRPPPRLRRARASRSCQWLATRPDTFQAFAAQYHTTTKQLGELARQAQPRLLILYHHSSTSPEKLVSEMMSSYSGHFVVARDLDVY